jgi:hypothetical protein
LLTGNKKKYSVGPDPLNNKHAVRELEEPTYSIPSHQNIDHGVAIEHPRRIILPGSFVRGHRLMMMRCTGIIVYLEELMARFGPEYFLVFMLPDFR